EETALLSSLTQSSALSPQRSALPFTFAFAYNPRMTTALVYDNAFTNHETGHHPENPDRFRVILSALEGDETLWAELDKLAPKAATDEDITRCHSGMLVEHIGSLCERGVPFVDLDTVISAQSFDVARLAAGAVVVGVD